MPISPRRETRSSSGLGIPTRTVPSIRFGATGSRFQSAYLCFQVSHISTLTMRDPNEDDLHYFPQRCRRPMTKISSVRKLLIQSVTLMTAVLVNLSVNSAFIERMKYLPIKECCKPGKTQNYSTLIQSSFFNSIAPKRSSYFSIQLRIRIRI